MNPEDEKLTEADRHALERMPDDDWFTADSLPPVVRCPRFAVID